MLGAGVTAKIGEEQETIVGHFKLGLFFYGEGTAIVRNTDFPRLANRDSSKVSIGDPGRGSHTRVSMVHRRAPAGERIPVTNTYQTCPVRRRRVAGEIGSPVAIADHCDPNV